MPGELGEHGPPMSRAAWSAAVAAWSPPPALRPVKGTLLVLGRLMRPDAVLQRSREDLVDRTGLPRRTLNRHLQLAVATGWLQREHRGQKGVHAVYRPAFPAGSQRAIRGLLTGTFSGPPTRTLNPALSGPVGGPHQEETEPAGEGVAVEEGRDRRDDPAPSRVPPADRGGLVDDEHGGPAGGRPRQGVPDRAAGTAASAGRSTGGGPAQDTPRPGSAAEGPPQRAAAAAHPGIATVAASRGDHHSARPPARDPPAAGVHSPADRSDLEETRTA